MENPAPKLSPARLLALRFISGKYQGSEFPLGNAQEVIVGRSSDLDMVLVEDMVSRRHARIVCADEQITIEDLGSTNGTFVNGEKIKKTALKEGDRVLIGTSILKVVPTDPLDPSLRRRKIDEVPSTRTSQTRSMSGAIEEIPLPDLLQLFGTSKKSGVLTVRSGDDVGRVFLRKGAIIFATINDSEELLPLKCAFRILSWAQGTFELEPPTDDPVEGAINISVQELLMEGLRQIDEYEALKAKLPPESARLVVDRPLRAPLRNLSPVELDTLQLAFNYGLVRTVLDRNPAPDLEAATAILNLVKQGYLRVE